LRCHERRQHRQPGPSPRRLVLRQDAGAAQRKVCGAVQLIQNLQLFAEQQVVHIADEGVATQVVGRADGRMALQVAARA
jgi:hypothetical protein